MATREDSSNRSKTTCTTNSRAGSDTSNGLKCSWSKWTTVSFDNNVSTRRTNTKPTNSLYIVIVYRFAEKRRLEVVQCCKIVSWARRRSTNYNNNNCVTCNITCYPIGAQSTTSPLEVDCTTAGFSPVGGSTSCSFDNFATIDNLVAPLLNKAIYNNNLQAVGWYGICPASADTIVEAYCCPFNSASFQTVTGITSSSGTAGASGFAPIGRVFPGRHS